MRLDRLSYPNESHLKYIYIYISSQMVGSVESHMILRSYHFCDLTTILNFLVRWDCKIVRFYDPNRDFDNHEPAHDWWFRWSSEKQKVCKKIPKDQSFCHISLAHYTCFITLSPTGIHDTRQSLKRGYIDR